MNILRRLSLWRLLLLCGVVVVAGVSATAIALGLDSGPVPAPKRLAVAVHDALTAPAVPGVSARIQLTDHLLEGANLASGGDGEAGQLTKSPLLSGASGRMWIANDGRARLELQSEKGDTQILYDGHTLSLYDVPSNTLYRYKLPGGEGPDAAEPAAGKAHEAPTVAKIEEAIAHLSKHATVSGATPTDVAGQAAYTVRLSPNEAGSQFGGVELSFDAVHGTPLRAAIYSSTTPAPVIELAATEISYEPVAASVFEFTPRSGAKIEEVGGGEHGAASASRTRRSKGARRHAHKADASSTAGQPKLTTKGHGITTIGIVESQAKKGGSSTSAALPEGLPQVKINGVSATELATSLGTLLTFERSGVRYVLLGSLKPAAIEAVARGL